MKVLITGGAGFMGSNHIHYLLSKYRDYKIVNLDKLTYCGNLENLKDIENNSNYEFVKGDICDEKIVDQVVENGIDVIINFAAETHVDRSILTPKDFTQTDVFGTQTLLEAARKYKIKKYIQISTDEVYGSTKKKKFKENHPLKPNSPYSASKAGGDMLVRAYHITYNVPTIITRSCNYFGPYQYPEKLIPLFITNLLDGKKVPLYGDGKNVREWVFTEDVSLAIDLIMHKGKVGQIYNISSGWSKTNLQITKTILKILGKNESVIEYVKDRPGHDFKYAVDWKKLNRLGWKPTSSFEKKMKIVVDWYVNNENWWKKLKSGEYLEYYKKQYKK